MIYQLFSTNGTLTACDAEPLQVGERVRYAHDGRIYTITGFDQIGAIITGDTGEQHAGQRLDSISPFTQIKRVEGADVASLEEVETLKTLAIRHRNEAREAQAREADQHKIDTEEQIRQLRQRYPGMQPDQPGKNCKKLLQDAFPHVKFSVRYSSYSGGNSLDVSWEFGPPTKDVERIAKQFQRGSFDGMVDCYEYDNSAAGRAWYAVLGGVKYVSCQRETGNLWESVKDVMKSKYVAETGWQTIERDASEALQSATFPQGFKEGDVCGVEWDNDNNRWTLTFPEPEKPTSPEPTQDAGPAVQSSGSVAGITVTENPSKDGVEVRFASKPAAAILTKLKDAGFRWSKFQGLWYAKRTAWTLRVAREIGGITQDAPNLDGAMIQAAEDYAADLWYSQTYGNERY